MRTTRFWNNLHQVRTQSKDWKGKPFKVLGAKKPKILFIHIFIFEVIIFLYILYEIFTFQPTSLIDMHIYPIYKLLEWSTSFNENISWRMRINCNRYNTVCSVKLTLAMANYNNLFSARNIVNANNWHRDCYDHVMVENISQFWKWLYTRQR